MNVDAVYTLISPFSSYVSMDTEIECYNVLLTSHLFLMLIVGENFIAKAFLMNVNCGLVSYLIPF